MHVTATASDLRASNYYSIYTIAHAQCTLLPHQLVVIARQGKQDFNKGSEVHVCVSVCMCMCLCAHCLEANGLHYKDTAHV